MKDYVGLSKKHFDGQAAEYDQRDTAYYSKYPKISCNDVAKLLQDASYENLLDVGCGTGDLLDLLQKQKPADYHGLDLSPEMLKVARKNSETMLSWSRAWLTSCPMRTTPLILSPVCRAFTIIQTRTKPCSKHIAY